MKESINQALQAITARSAEDRAFRKQLLENPRAAMQKIMGTAIPEDLRIKFIEKDPDIDVLIVLPECLLEEGELTEEDVAEVAGGTDWGCQDANTTQA